MLTNLRDVRFKRKFGQPLRWRHLRPSQPCALDTPGILPCCEIFHCCSVSVDPQTLQRAGSVRHLRMHAPQLVSGVQEQFSAGKGLYSIVPLQSGSEHGSPSFIFQEYKAQAKLRQVII